MFNIDREQVRDKTEITNNFNEYVSHIDPQLASKIRFSKINVSTTIYQLQCTIRFHLIMLQK